MRVPSLLNGCFIFIRVCRFSIWVSFNELPFGFESWLLFPWWLMAFSNERSLSGIFFCKTCNTCFIILCCSLVFACVCMCVRVCVHAREAMRLKWVLKANEKYMYNHIIIIMMCRKTSGMSSWCRQTQPMIPALSLAVTLTTKKAFMYMADIVMTPLCSWYLQTCVTLISYLVQPRS